jgi:hypothetical protein
MERCQSGRSGRSRKTILSILLYPSKRKKTQENTRFSHFSPFLRNVQKCPEMCPSGSTYYRSFPPPEDPRPGIQCGLRRPVSGTHLHGRERCPCPRRCASSLTSSHLLLTGLWMEAEAAPLKGRAPVPSWGQARADVWEGFSTTRPGAGKAHGTARHAAPVGDTGPRQAGLFQAVWPTGAACRTAGLKQPSSRNTTSQTLGRRNAALLRSSKLDLASPTPTLYSEAGPAAKQDPPAPCFTPRVESCAYHC